MSADSSFLSFERVPVGAHGETKIELHAAVLPDIYGDIDQRNGWDEPGVSPTHDERHDQIEFEARVFRTALQFCWDGVVLTDLVSFRTAIRRFVAVAQWVAPDALRVPSVRARPSVAKDLGSPVTIGQLAVMPQLRTNAPHLKRLLRKFLKQVNFDAKAKRLPTGR